MQDRYRMDGHKLFWHLDRVNQWREGKRVVPLHIDVGLSKGCNIKCEYCFGAVQGNLYKKGAEVVFPREALLRYMRDAGAIGVRSMAFIGESEPLMNPAVYEAVVAGVKAGVDIAIGTNGVLYDTGKAGEEALEHLSWLRFNLSAADDKAYRKVHGSKEFPTLIEKIKFCVALKQRKGLKATIGLQMVLTPNNVDQAIPLAKLGKELGVDYLVVKQCSDTVTNALGIYKRLGEYGDFTETLLAAEKESTDSYQVTVKWSKVQNEGIRNYDQCLGVPFLLYSSGNGRLYPCGDFFDKKEEEYLMGDLVEKSFKEIFESDRYWEIVEKVKLINVHKECYSNCRTHAINEFLWVINHPPEHVNFA